MAVQPALILASASPRRSELLRQIGVEFRVAPVSINEAPLPEENPCDYVSRLAMAKSREGYQQHAQPGDVVLGADTIVVFNGQMLGKPQNEIEACTMLQNLSANQHQVYTAVALTNGQREELGISKTRVCFRAITLKEIQDYWDSGEPRDKAGGYAIQGKGAVFVSEICGSYSGVVGLPLQETSELLQLFGIPVWQVSRT